MNKNRWIFAFAVLLVSSLACSLFSGDAKTPATPVSSGGARATLPPTVEKQVEATVTQPVKGSDNYETEFPLPPEISNFTSMGNGGINFQTKMSLKDAIAFYREAFTKAGYKERTINTVINDTTFSMVFDGHASGKEIVIQGVDLGGGSTNVNIRLEDV
jgi:hypothetical protein